MSKKVQKPVNTNIDEKERIRLAAQLAMQSGALLAEEGKSLLKKAKEKLANIANVDTLDPEERKVVEYERKLKAQAAAAKAGAVVNTLTATAFGFVKGFVAGATGKTTKEMKAYFQVGSGDEAQAQK